MAAVALATNITSKCSVSALKNFSTRERTRLMRSVESTDDTEAEWGFPKRFEDKSFEKPSMSDLEYNVVPAWSRYVVSIMRKLDDKKSLEVLLYTSQLWIFFLSDMFDVTDVILLHRIDICYYSNVEITLCVLRVDIRAYTNRQLNRQLSLLVSLPRKSKSLLGESESIMWTTATQFIATPLGRIFWPSLETINS